MAEFFASPPEIDRSFSLTRKRNVVIFHCEFSSERAPNLWVWHRTLWCNLIIIVTSMTLTLTLIHPASNWTHWATLRRHPCLSRAATSASSQVNPIFRRSLLTTPLQFALSRPGPLLYPGTCQYSACCGMRWWSIRKTCPSQRNRLSLSVLSMVCCPVLVLTSTVVMSVRINNNNNLLPLLTP